MTKSLARQLVDAQAEDEGLWFRAENAAEAYLQQSLRALHAAVEEAESAEPNSYSEFRIAARAVVDRWDTPQWKDAVHTAHLITRLRRTLEATACDTEQVCDVAYKVIASMLDHLGQIYNDRATKIAENLSNAQKDK